MLNIAVVEDDEGYRSPIAGFIDRFWTERGMEVKVIQFPDGGEILKDYRPGFDIILLDIEMPQVDGMSAAKVRGTMQSAEKELEERHFVRCNYWYLVNLRHVSEVKDNMAVVAGDELEISRRNRGVFLHALTTYVGGNT